MTGNLWDEVIEFHEKTEEKFPSGRAGLEAIRTIQRIIDSRWQPEKPGIAVEYHPGQSFWGRFWHGYEPNYRWLIHFARKLEILVEIPGHDYVLDQLRSPEKYASMLTEMDLGLKLKLSGVSCRYDYHKGKPTPDLVANVAGDEVDVEITSLNRPQEDTIGMEALSLPSMIAIQAKCQSGGIWARVPKKTELARIRSNLLAGVADANAERRLVEVNEPGVLQCYLAPSDLADQIKIPWTWGTFVMRTRSPVAKIDRLARTIEKKAKNQLSRGKPSLLVVYDRFSSPDEARKFVDEKDIELTIGVFQNLAGIALVCPFATALMIGQNFITKELTKENRTLVECTLPDNEAEISTIWRNPLNKHPSTIDFMVDCLRSFPAKLADRYRD